MDNDVKIAVFDTSSIFDIKRTGSDPVHSWDAHPKFDLPNGDTVVSLDRVEQAICEGYACYVVSTRTKLGDHDQWWAHLVGVDRIFMAEEVVDDDSRSASVSAGWIKLFAHLRLVYPQVNGRLDFWTVARNHLLTNYPVRDGRSFKGAAELAHDEGHAKKFWAWRDKDNQEEISV